LPRLGGGSLTPPLRSGARFQTTTAGSGGRNRRPSAYALTFTAREGCQRLCLRGRTTPPQPGCNMPRVGGGTLRRSSVPLSVPPPGLRWVSGRGVWRAGPGLRATACCSARWCCSRASARDTGSRRTVRPRRQESSCLVASAFHWESASGSLALVSSAGCSRERRRREGTATSAGAPPNARA